jgi:hypothetical protein
MKIPMLTRKLALWFSQASLAERRLFTSQLKEAIPSQTQHELYQRGLLLKDNPFLKRQPLSADEEELVTSTAAPVSGLLSLTFTKVEMHFNCKVDYDISDWDRKNYWIGLYRKKDPSSKYLAYTWVKARTGTYTFGLTKDGTYSQAGNTNLYEARLIDNNDYRTVATSDQLIVCSSGVFINQSINSLLTSPLKFGSESAEPEAQLCQYSTPLSQLTAQEIISEVGELSTEDAYLFCINAWRALSAQEQRDILDLVVPSPIRQPAVEVSSNPSIPEEALGDGHESSSSQESRKLTLTVTKGHNYLNLALAYAVPGFNSGDQVKVAYTDYSALNPTEYAYKDYTVTSLSKEEKIETGKSGFTEQTHGQFYSFDAHYMSAGKLLCSSTTVPFFFTRTISQIPLPSSDFEYKPTYRKSDAIACAYLSLMVYDFTDLEERLRSVHDRALSLKSIVERPAYNTQALVATSETNDALYVAFRGSQEWEDWYHNAKIFANTVIDGPAQALSGFATRYADVSRVLFPKIQAALSGGSVRRIYVTGHSLGAALAQLLAYRLIKTMTTKEIVLYTYGGPPIINQGFNDEMNSILTTQAARVGSFNIFDSRDVVALGIVKQSIYLGYCPFPLRIQRDGPNGNAHSLSENYIPITKLLPEKR